ncbi:MAG: hypothetical protein LDL53_04460 [Candidatus Hydrogenedens sp.]|nr:hypothetical protein [Candidatus Hydrogenedens sp.]
MEQLENLKTNSIVLPCDITTSLIDVPTKIIIPESNSIPIDNEFVQLAPLWVRTVDNQFCGIVQEQNEWQWICSTAIRRSAKSQPIIIQQALKGKSYYLIGFRDRYHFFSTEILSVEFTAGSYRVPKLIWAPSDCSGFEIKRIIEKSKMKGKQLPRGNYCTLFEFVSNQDGVFLTFAQILNSPDKVLTKICKESSGVDLQKINDAIQHHEIPNHVPSKELGCAVSWFIPHSGVVQSIEGIEEVKRMEGVKEVFINIQAGDSITHVTDISSRDRIGYILAVCPDAFTAKNRALTALSKIKINTQNILP